VLVLLLLVAAGLGIYHYAVGLFHGSEKDLVDLALASYLILLSGPLAHYAGLPVALIEILLGVTASATGAHRGEGLRLLGEIGANMVLFMAGAEIDVALLRRRSKEALALALLVIAGPLLAVPAFPVSGGSRLLLAAALAPTSVAITYAILQPTGLVRGRTGQVVLAAAMISDVAGMILLNLAGGGWSPVSALYIVVILAALALYPLFPRLGSVGFEAEVRIVMMAILVLGVASELLGIHSVLTSFILGLVVGETVRARRILREKLEGMVFGFFAPFFFITSGLTINSSLLLKYLPTILALGTIVFLAKALPAHIYLTLTGRARHGAAKLYSASLAPLLTVTVIAAETGLRQGQIGEETYTLLLGIVIMTTLISGIASRIYGKGLEIPEKHYH